MQYDITLSGDDVLTIISLLENAGSAQLAVKVRDQMYEQRQMSKKIISKKKVMTVGQSETGGMAL